VVEAFWAKLRRAFVKAFAAWRCATATQAALQRFAVFDFELFFFGTAID
jgi:hypothetical protein